MSPAWIVCLKEIRETLRDRRVMLAALVWGPLLGPLLFGTTLWVIGARAEDDRTRTLQLPVAGAAHAPNLVAFLRMQGIAIEDAPADVEAAVRTQAQDVILRIAPDYGAAWRAGQPARVELVYDGSRQFARRAVERTRAALAAYGAQVGALRLQVRGVNPQVAAPIAVQDQDLSTPRSRAALVLALLPFLLIVSTFAGSMNVAIDTTTGERERASLEPLLITPVARGQIMLGKLAATTAFALTGLAVCVTAFAVVVGVVPAAGMFEIDIDAATALAIFFAIAPVAVLAASSQMIVASLANSFKEAQGYLSVFLILPMAPSLVQLMTPLKPAGWMMAMPLLSQGVLIDRLARGEPLSALDVVASVAGTAALAALLCAVTLRLYRREGLAIAA